MFPHWKQISRHFCATFEGNFSHFRVHCTTCISVPTLEMSPILNTSVSFSIESSLKLQHLYRAILKLWPHETPTWDDNGKFYNMHWDFRNILQVLQPTVALLPLLLPSPSPPPPSPPLLILQLLPAPPPTSASLCLAPAPHPPSLHLCPSSSPPPASPPPAPDQHPTWQNNWRLNKIHMITSTSRNTLLEGWWVRQDWARKLHCALLAISASSLSSAHHTILPFCPSLYFLYYENH